MQTFLPDHSYFVSARILDRQRLGKQRVEAYQILRALRGESKGWVNHPATRMWRGYERSLIIYTELICQEWIDRGYKDSIKPKVSAMLADYPDYVSPPWLTYELIRTHQSNLVRKNPHYYRPFFPEVPDDLPYLWPVAKDNR
jgi:hypothetical protein